MRQLLILLSILVLTSCKNNNQEQGNAAGDFSIKEFNAIGNFPAENKMVRLDLDYTDAIDSGFVIPSVQQIAGRNFIFSFQLKNNSQKGKQLYYKIYYQNESYKLNEYDSSTGTEHEFA